MGEFFDMAMNQFENEKKIKEEKARVEFESIDLRAYILKIVKKDQTEIHFEAKRRLEETLKYIDEYYLQEERDEAITKYHIQISSDFRNDKSESRMLLVKFSDEGKVDLALFADYLIQHISSVPSYLDKMEFLTRFSIEHKEGLIKQELYYLVKKGKNREDKNVQKEDKSFESLLNLEGKKHISRIRKEYPSLSSHPKTKRFVYLLKVLYDLNLTNSDLLDYSIIELHRLMTAFFGSIGSWQALSSAIIDFKGKLSLKDSKTLSDLEYHNNRIKSLLENHHKP